MLPAEIANFMSGLAFVSCVTCGILRLVLGRRMIKVKQAHLLGAGVTVIMVGNSAIHLYLTNDPLCALNFEPFSC